jgi:hypothetical protein
MHPIQMAVIGGQDIILILFLLLRTSISGLLTLPIGVPFATLRDPFCRDVTPIITSVPA